MKPAGTLERTRTSRDDDTVSPIVLVIDDDLDTCELIAGLLGGAGYAVVAASDGREGLALLASAPPALILLDVCMPRMSGAEFRQAQRRDRGWIQIPTVVMTGADEETLLDLGVSGTLRKPFTANELLGLVRRLCASPKRDA